MKILSFIIPAYNSEQFLRKCVDSMLASEELEKLEIIIVNDGSTDRTPEIGEEYCEKYPDTVHLISQENRGHGGALNTGCAAARGKYLKVVDADDWVETRNLSAFIALLENCQAHVVLTHYRTADIVTGQTRDWEVQPDAFGQGYSLNNVMTSWERFRNGLTFHGIAYRTDFYQKCAAPLPEHIFYEDHVFAAFPCCCAESVVCFDLCIYNYRIGDVAQSVSEENQLKRIDQLEAVALCMAGEYQNLPGGPGKGYAARKLQGVILSYLTTALLSNPDREEGRRLAKHLMTECQEATPEIYAAIQGKYWVFCLMNRLHWTRKNWNRVHSSRMYAWLRK